LQEVGRDNRAAIGSLHRLTELHRKFAAANCSSFGSVPLMLRARPQISESVIWFL
jgi:hypothetical protein